MERVVLTNHYSMSNIFILQYHGGTNFGRASSAYIKTSYYDQAPLDEYGEWRSFLSNPAFFRQPK